MNTPAMSCPRKSAVVLCHFMRRSSSLPHSVSSEADASRFLVEGQMPYQTRALRFRGFTDKVVLPNRLDRSMIEQPFDQRIERAARRLACGRTSRSSRVVKAVVATTGKARYVSTGLNLARTRCRYQRTTE